MKQKSLVLKINILLILFNSTIVLSQSVNQISLSPKQNHVAYVKNQNSLWIGKIENSDYEKKIYSNLKDFNERFFIWSNQGKEYIFESNNVIYTYELKNEKLDSISLPANLNLFKYYLIDQVALVANKIYCLDLETRSIEPIVEDSEDIGNLTISEDGKHLAYQHYNSTYERGSISGIKIVNLAKNEIIYAHQFETQSFLSNLSFLGNEKLLFRNVYGSNYLIDLDSRTINEYTVDSSGYFLNFFNKEIVTLQYEKGKKVYSLFNPNSNSIRSVLITKNGVLKDLESIENNSFSAYFLDESGNEPKSLMRKNTNSDKPEIAFNFIGQNPLRDSKYHIINYLNKDQNNSNGFLYLPSNYENNTSKLPLIILAYGGYQDRYPDFDYFMNKIFFDYLNSGYALALVNTRGYASERKGDEYGKAQLEDTELFINTITAEFSIDKENIIVAGHSHGATMVFYYLSHSSIFKGGIAINGAADWIEQAKLKSMTGLPGEMGGEPNEFMEKYQRYSPLANISESMSPILIISGEKDKQIPFEINSKSFYDKTQEYSIKSKYIHFKDEGHIINLKKNIQLIKNQILQFIENEIN